MLRTLFSFRGLVLAFGLAALGLPIALVAQLGIARTLTGIDADLAAIREGQFAASDLLALQLDEETALRGYAASGVKSFLDPYRKGLVEFPGRLTELRTQVARLGDEVPARRAADELGRVNDDWLVEVAIPVVEAGNDTLRRQVRGKALIDRFRADLAPIQAAFERHHVALVARRDATIRRNVTATLYAVGAIAIEALFFGVLFARTRRELDRERSFVMTLQNATSGRLVPPEHLLIGTAYQSATRGMRVGGDVYDVYRLSDARTLLLIADVSGKGLPAAVDTTFVRYAIRTLATEHPATADIVTRFNALYDAADPAPEAFVTLFVGIYDRREQTLSYTNAGHEACWIRRVDGLDQLAPTGSAVGIGRADFEEARARLAPGDLLLLATDGLTEARDPDGGFVTAERAGGWIANADATSPQSLVDGIVTEVRRHVRGRISDDLAILAVTPL